jgi:hypothetical protein
MADFGGMVVDTSLGAVVRPSGWESTNHFVPLLTNPPVIGQVDFAFIDNIGDGGGEPVNGYGYSHSG